jgi:hypothetical protein
MDRSIGKRQRSDAEKNQTLEWNTEQTVISKTINKKIG